jgi:hypothetical protein
MFCVDVRWLHWYTPAFLMLSCCCWLFGVVSITPVFLMLWLLPVAFSSSCVDVNDRVVGSSLYGFNLL